MRRAPVLLALPLLCVLAACGSDVVTVTEEPVAPASVLAPDGDPLPADEVPPPVVDGEVEAWTTVLDEGDGPRLCLGGVMDSLPPQCEGRPVEGWDWDDVAPGSFEEALGTRWGDYLVRGTVDATTFTLVEAVPAEAAPAPGTDPEPWPSPTPTDGERWTEEQAVEALDDLALLPGFASGGPVEVGGDDAGVEVAVEVDDGSLQAWADLAYGGHVVVVPLLEPVGTD